jgi:hypothetical protein
VPTQSPSDQPDAVELKMRNEARRHVARYGWPTTEATLNRLLHALQPALPKPRPKEVTQASGTVAGRRGRAGGSVGRGGPPAGPEPHSASQAATGASEGVGGQR